MNTIGKGLLNQQAELVIHHKNDMNNTDPDNHEQISIGNMKTALVENELNAQKNLTHQKLVLHKQRTKIVHENKDLLKNPNHHQPESEK